MLEIHQGPHPCCGHYAPRRRTQAVGHGQGSDWCTHPTHGPGHPVPTLTGAVLTRLVISPFLQMSCALTTPIASCTPRRWATPPRCFSQTRPVRRSCRASGQRALPRTAKPRAASDPAPSSSLTDPLCPRQGDAEDVYRDLQPSPPSQPPLGPLRHRPALSPPVPREWG